MEFKGTPGPWNYSLNKDGPVISVHTGNASAEVSAGNDEWNDPNICGIWYDDLDISMANAQLIAAAPDLLGALQLLLHGWENSDLNHDVTESFDIARLAIAKALSHDH